MKKKDSQKRFGEREWSNLSSEEWETDQNIQKRVHSGPVYEEWEKKKKKNHSLNWSQSAEEVSHRGRKKECNPELTKGSTWRGSTIR